MCADPSLEAISPRQSFKLAGIRLGSPTGSLDGAFSLPPSLFSQCVLAVEHPDGAGGSKQDSAEKNRSPEGGSSPGGAEIVTIPGGVPAADADQAERCRHGESLDTSQATTAQCTNLTRI